MDYQPQMNDYRTKVEINIPDASFFCIWSYVWNDWHFVHRLHEAAMQEKLQEYRKIYSADDYHYWRHRSFVF